MTGTWVEHRQRVEPPGYVTGAGSSADQVAGYGIRRPISRISYVGSNLVGCPEHVPARMPGEGKLAAIDDAPGRYLRVMSAG